MNGQNNDFFKNIATFCTFLDNENVTPEDVFFIPEDYPDTTNTQYFGITTASGAESVKAGIYYYKQNDVYELKQAEPAARRHISSEARNVYKRGRQGERRDTLHFNGLFSKKRRAKN